MGALEQNINKGYNFPTPRKEEKTMSFQLSNLFYEILRFLVCTNIDTK